MNKIERLVYDILKSTPWLKLWVRNVYQAVFDLLPTPKEFAVSKIETKEGYFYGFHDTTPFSEDGEMVLANRLPFSGIRMPGINDLLDVGYFNFNGGQIGNYTIVGQTSAWNFHKGCRLQWVDPYRLIFNFRDGASKKLASKIINIQTKEEKTVCLPIDTVSSNGKFATSFCYRRLEKFMPGYGYSHLSSSDLPDSKSPIDSGLFLVDLVKNDYRLLVSLDRLASDTKMEENSQDSYHYVTHSSFSHDGRFVSFFHRWTGEDTRKRYTRLVIYDLVNECYFAAPTGYMVSHYVWNKRNEIVVYCNYNNVDSHVLLKVQDLDSSHNIVYPALNSDGHQSFITDTKIVTDTYPDRRRMAKLHLVDIEKNTVQLLARVRSPKRYQTKTFFKHIACDLHPRVSPDGKYVCFDTVKTGERALAIMRLP